MGRRLSPWYEHMILVSGYPVLTAVNWPQPGRAISARKCKLSLSLLTPWTDGRTVMWLPNFIGWKDNQIFLAFGLHFLRARVELLYKVNTFLRQTRITGARSGRVTENWLYLVVCRHSPKDSRGNKAECTSCETMIPDWYVHVLGFDS